MDKIRTKLLKVRKSIIDNYNLTAYAGFSRAAYRSLTDSCTALKSLNKNCQIQKKSNEKNFLCSFFWGESTSKFVTIKYTNLALYFV